MNDDGKKTLRCSFCGKHEQQIRRMIQGPGVRICDECVHLCMSILNDGFEPDAPALEQSYLGDHMAFITTFVLMGVAALIILFFVRDKARSATVAARSPSTTLPASTA